LTLVTLIINVKFVKLQGSAMIFSKPSNTTYLWPTVTLF